MHYCLSSDSYLISRALNYQGSSYPPVKCIYKRSSLFTYYENVISDSLIWSWGCDASIRKWWQTQMDSSRGVWLHGNNKSITWKHILKLLSVRSKGKLAASGGKWIDDLQLYRFSSEFLLTLIHMWPAQYFIYHSCAHIFSALCTSLHHSLCKPTTYPSQNVWKTNITEELLSEERQTKALKRATKRKFYLEESTK